jgi:lipoprotein-anchoring transpeptidase ErfK/SrfK
VLFRRFASTGAVFCVLVLAAAPASGQERRVAQGVSAGGVDLSNLTLAEAQSKLETTLTPIVGKTLVLGVAGRPFELTMQEAQLNLDALVTAKRALYAPPGPPAQEGGGAVVGTVVPVALSHSRLAVRAFVQKAAARVYRAPRNATIKIGLRRITVRRSRYGHALDRAEAEKAIDAALDDAAAPRVLHQRVAKVRANVNANDLRRTHSTVITVDKANFKLRLFKHLKVVRTYRVAVGLPAYPTPSGRFAIQNKQIDPVWSVPNSAWAGELAGTTVVGGSAANPLKARWMGIANGVGIHGTGQDWSIGSRASHGCIRMHVWDVKALYRRVPVGTAVLIR